MFEHGLTKDWNLKINFWNNQKNTANKYYIIKLHPQILNENIVEYKLSDGKMTLKWIMWKVDVDDLPLGLGQHEDLIWKLNDYVFASGLKVDANLSSFEQKILSTTVGIYGQS